VGGNENNEKKNLGIENVGANQEFYQEKMLNYPVMLSNGEGFDWDSMIL
jgi:hypothetical protein